MKNILSLLLIIACIHCVSSCKEKNTNAEANIDSVANQDGVSDDRLKLETKTVGKLSKAIDSDEQLSIIKNMAKVQPYEIEGMIQDATTIINHRYKETNNKSFVILENNLWEYEFIFDGKKMSEIDQFKGCWIDFEDDNTYTYGRFQEVLGGGIYTFSLDTGLLLLIDNAPNIKPQEFKTTVTDQTLVMVGNEIYKDNNYNSKLKRITERPAK